MEKVVETGGLTINIHQPSGFNGDGVYWVFVGYTMVTFWSFLNVFNGRLRTSGWFLRIYDDASLFVIFHTTVLDYQSLSMGTLKTHGEKTCLTMLDTFKSLKASYDCEDLKQRRPSCPRTAKRAGHGPMAGIQHAWPWPNGSKTWHNVVTRMSVVSHPPFPPDHPTPTAG